MEFYQACVHPVLQDVQKHHQHVLDLITNDKSQGGITEESIYFTQLLCLFQNMIFFSSPYMKKYLHVLETYSQPCGDIVLELH